MAIHRVTATWTGFTGGPGYTSFYFSPFTGGGSAGAARQRVLSFFSSMSQIIATGARIDISPTIEVIDEETGTLQSYIDDDTEVGYTQGASTGSYVGSAGGVVSWSTNTVVSGRRVRGRTFIVPMRTTAFQDDGTLTTQALTSMRDGADALMASDFDQQLVIWSRPRGGSGGVAAPVTGYRVPDMAAVLRSRRD